MRSLIRALLAMFILSTLIGGSMAAAPAPASAAPAEAPHQLQLSLNPPNGSGILSGRITGQLGDMQFVTVTVVLLDGTSRSVNVDSSTGWGFSFGVLPTDGFVSIAITEHPIPMPQLFGTEWDYGYLHGYFYAYPFAGTPWSRFTGYAYPSGYGWGYYPFGYYSYARYLYTDFGFPYYWQYTPLHRNDGFVYYGINGLSVTYQTPLYAYNSFGTITQPYYRTLKVSQPHIYSLPNPVRYSTAVLTAPTPPAKPASTIGVQSTRNLPITVLPNYNSNSRGH